MDEILVATPLRNGSVTEPFSFSNGVSIQPIRPILWERSVARKFMSDDERDRLSRSDYWIAVSKHVDDYRVDRNDEDLYENARRAMYALQIIHPVGGRNIYLKFVKLSQGFDNLGSHHPNSMSNTLIGRLAVPQQQGFQEDFEKILQGVNRAFDEKVVRLQNPILLLEHGLQVNHVYLSTLMWVMGLDMLFMAGEKTPFIDRTLGFLSANTFLFPRVLYPLRQPQSLVKDVVEDVYELRNIVAHGREIPGRYHQKHHLLDENGRRINIDDYSYAAVLWESALFLLVRALRKIMLDENMIDAVKDEAKWKQHLKLAARLEQGRNKK
jgi:hypothetical protein